MMRDVMSRDERVQRLKKRGRPVEIDAADFCRQISRSAMQRSQPVVLWSCGADRQVPVESCSDPTAPLHHAMSRSMSTRVGQGSLSAVRAEIREPLASLLLLRGDHYQHTARSRISVPSKIYITTMRAWHHSYHRSK